MSSRKDRYNWKNMTMCQRYGSSKPNYPIRIRVPVIEIPSNATAEQVREVLDSTFEARMKYAFDNNLWI